MKRTSCFSFSVFFSFLLTGCSTVQFAYNRADWLLESEIEDYVDLEAENEKKLGELLDAALATHRAELLPLYAEFLDRLALEVDTRHASLTSEETKVWLLTIKNLYDQTLEKALPQAEAFFLMLNENEISSLEKKSLARIADTRKERLEENLSERKKRRVKSTRRFFEYFTGDLETFQVKIIDELYTNWPENGWPLWLQFRERILAELLKHLRSPSADRSQDLKNFLRIWFTSPETYYSKEHLEWLNDVRTRQSDFLPKFIRILNKVQRNRMVRKLRNLSQDFRELHLQGTYGRRLSPYLRRP